MKAHINRLPSIKQSPFTFENKEEFLSDTSTGAFHCFQRAVLSQEMLYAEPWLLSLSGQCTSSANSGVKKYMVQLEGAPSPSCSPGLEEGYLLRALQRDSAWPQGRCWKTAVPQAGVCFVICCCLTYPSQSHASQKHGILNSSLNQQYFKVLYPDSSSYYPGFLSDLGFL